MTASGDTHWRPVEAELALWSAAGRTARLWLRDDDAYELTGALDRLVDMVGEHAIAATLAIIPALMTDALVAQVRDNPLRFPAAHGLWHRNHAGPADKKIELGGGRSVEAVLADLEESRDLMAQAFGALAVNMLVPPWNRISNAAAESVSATGFDVLSTYGWKPSTASVDHLNTHVDLIDWQSGRQGKPATRIASEITEALRVARDKDFAPIGILTHHLAHDAAAWTTLKALFNWSAGRDNIAWCSATDLLGR